jgi:hypothetical protein
MAAGGVAGAAAGDENVPVVTSVPPPPLDRTRAIFDALGPALRDICDRMGSASVAEYEEAWLSMRSGSTRS